jgi:aspartate/methionine/tyrosine aminotransferase
VFSGAEEGIFCFAHALLQPGDHVIVHTPCYQSHLSVAESLGAQLSPWSGRESQGWSLDPDELRTLIRPNTKALFLNTPHNPTGYLMDAERFRAVCAICERHGIVLFGDEVFRESELDAQTRLPAACDELPSAVSLGVMSKTYGLPGLRIGWIATHQGQLRRKMAALKDYTTICNSGPSEFLAEIGLKHRSVLSSRTVGLLQDNLRLLDAFFARHRELFSWSRPQASPMGFPKLCVGDVENFCDRAVREAGVLLLPASVYDDPGNHFRIGFGRANFPDALRAFEEWLISTKAHASGISEPD